MLVKHCLCWADKLLCCLSLYLAQIEYMQEWIPFDHS